LAALRTSAAPLTSFLELARIECRRFGQWVQDREAERSWEEKEIIERLGARIDGEERTRLVVPFVIQRYEDATERWETSNDALRASARLALCGFRELARGMMRWFEHDDLAGAAQVVAVAERLLHLSLEMAQGADDPDVVRARDATERLLPDAEDLCGCIEELAENRDRRPARFAPLEDEPPWSVEEWEEYFDEEMLAKSRALRYLAEHGYSRENFAQAYRIREEEHEKLERCGNDMLARHQRQMTRDAVFDPDNPEDFLDLDTIPDHVPEIELDSFFPHLDDDEFEEEPSAEEDDWSMSLPEIQQWEDRDLPDDEFCNERDPLGEEIFSLAAELGERFDERDEPGPVADCLFELLYLAGMAVSMSRFYERQANSIAPRIAQYRRAARILKQTAQVAHDFPEPGIEGIEAQITELQLQAERRLRDIEDERRS